MLFVNFNTNLESIGLETQPFFALEMMSIMRTNT